MQASAVSLITPERTVSFVDVSVHAAPEHIIDTDDSLEAVVGQSRYLSRLSGLATYHPSSLEGKDGPRTRGSLGASGTVYSWLDECNDPRIRSILDNKTRVLDLVEERLQARQKEQGAAFSAEADVGTYRTVAQLREHFSMLASPTPSSGTLQKPEA